MKYKNHLRTAKVFRDTKINLKVKYNPLCDYEAIPDIPNNKKTETCPGLNTITESDKIINYRVNLESYHVRVTMVNCIEV